MSRQQDKDSAKGSPEDSIENDTCTGEEDCPGCEKLEKLTDADFDCTADTDQEIGTITDPEISLENLVEAKHRILERARHRRILESIRSGPNDLTPNVTTRDQLTAGASSATSDTDTMKKAGLDSKEDESPSSETGLNSKEDTPTSSSETGLNPKEDWFKSPSSSESSTEDKVEIKACTRKDCQECEELRAVNEDHDFVVIDKSELCPEASATDEVLHVEVKDATKTTTKAGASSSKSDTNTIEKVGLNSKEDKSPSSETGLNSKEDTSPSSSEGEGFEFLDNEEG